MARNKFLRETCLYSTNWATLLFWITEAGLEPATQGYPCCSFPRHLPAILEKGGRLNKQDVQHLSDETGFEPVKPNVVLLAFARNHTATKFTENFSPVTVFPEASAVSLHSQHSQQCAKNKIFIKIIFNWLNIKKIYFKVAFIGKKRRILKNIFIDSYI